MSADDPDSPRPPRDTMPQRLKARSGRGTDGWRLRALEVGLSDGRGRPVRAPGLAAWLTDVAPRAACGREVSIALVDDATMRALNRAYRGQGHATDVLSFPTGDDARVAPRVARPGPRRRRPLTRRTAARAGIRLDRLEAGVSGSALDGPSPSLGDIVIARGVAARQARAAGHSLATELRVLALHGLLHLLGHDHEVDGGRMARLERRLRRKGRLREGLLERGGGR